MKVLNELKKLMGKKIDFDEIICCFEDEERVIVNESMNNGYDYLAYLNTADSTQYLFKTKDKIIEDVWMSH